MKEVGVRLVSIPDEIVLHRANHISKLLYPDPDEMVVTTYINSVEYADDTTLYDNVEHLQQATESNELSSISVFKEATEPAGMLENIYKRVHQLLLDIKARNLGVNTDGDKDTMNKISAGWRA